MYVVWWKREREPLFVGVYSTLLRAHAGIEQYLDFHRQIQYETAFTRMTQVDVELSTDPGNKETQELFKDLNKELEDLSQDEVYYANSSLRDQFDIYDTEIDTTACYKLVEDE